MSKREVAALACRILAVTIVALSAVRIIVVPVQIVMAIYSVMSGYRTDGTAATLIGGSISAILHLAIVCFLWTRSDWIARKIVPGEDESRRWPHIRVADLQVAAFSAIGVVSLLFGANYMSYSLGAYFRYSATYGGLRGGPFSVSEWLTMESTLSAIAYIALGLWLVVGSRQIVKFVRRIRRPEFDDPDVPPGAQVQQSDSASPDLMES